MKSYRNPYGPAFHQESWPFLVGKHGEPLVSWRVAEFARIQIGRQAEFLRILLRESGAEYLTALAHEASRTLTATTASIQRSVVDRFQDMVG